MAVAAPFNLKKWIEDNRDKLKPPVGNQCIYKDAENFIVMVVGGPNSRKDYHFNESEELYYQVEGNIVLKIIDGGEPRDIAINEGDMFLLPPQTPHSPQRGAGTVTWTATSSQPWLVVSPASGSGLVGSLRTVASTRYFTAYQWTRTRWA